MKYIHRRTLLVSAIDRDAVNAALERHGYGPDNLSVPMYLSADRLQTTPTHYACDIAMDRVMLEIIRTVISGKGEEHNKRMSQVESEKGLKRRQRESTTRRRR